MDTFVVFFTLLFQNPTITADEIERATAQSQSAAYFIKRDSVSIAEEILRCFYPTNRFMSSSIVERPWAQAAELGVRESVVFRIDYQDAKRTSGTMNVVLLSAKRKGTWVRMLSDASIEKNAECRVRN